MNLFLTLTPAMPNFIPKEKFTWGWNSFLKNTAFFSLYCFYAVAGGDFFGCKYPFECSLIFSDKFWKRLGLAIFFSSLWVKG